jgi:photosystem II PsbM protein
LSNFSEWLSQRSYEALVFWDHPWLAFEKVKNLVMRGSKWYPNVVDWKTKRGFLAMQVNDLGFVASILFVLVPTVFLLILYIQTASRQGGKDS